MDLRLGPDLTSVARGRRWLTERAVEAGAAESAVAVIRLLGSELLSNAILHGPDESTVTIRSIPHDGRLRVEVDDDGAEAPRLSHPLPDESGGRGMQLVDLFSESWGFERRAGGGKTVWFEVPL